MKEGWWKLCFECKNFIFIGEEYQLNNPKKCIEHKGKESMTREEYDFLSNKN